MLTTDLPLTAAEYAAIVRKETVTVRRQCKAGRIRGAVRVGGCWLIPRAAVPPGLLGERGETKAERTRRGRAAMERIAAIR